MACVKDKNHLSNIVKVCSKIIRVQQEDLCSFWDKRVVKKAKAIMEEHDHILSAEFQLMPSGCRLKAPPRRTKTISQDLLLRLL